MIIALDGIDGSGKSTVCALLRDYLTIDLQMNNVHLIQQPGATTLGKKLREIVKNPEYKPSPRAERLIFSVDRLQFEEEYRPLHECGDVIICDRFSLITDLVYGKAGGLNLVDLDRLQRTISHSETWLVPDVYFVFQLPFEDARARKLAMAKTEALKQRPERCRIEEKGEVFMRAVYDLYNGIVGTCDVDPVTQGYLRQLVCSRAKRVVPIDASKTVPEIVSALKDDPVVRGLAKLQGR